MKKIKVKKNGMGICQGNLHVDFSVADEPNDRPV